MRGGKRTRLYVKPSRLIEREYQGLTLLYFLDGICVSARFPKPLIEPRPYCIGGAQP